MKFENPFSRGVPVQRETHENPRRQVDLMRFDEKTMKPMVAASCILENGKIRIEGEEGELRGWLEKGVYSPTQHRNVTPQDGEAYLEALSYEFKSAHLFATTPRNVENLKDEGK